MNYLDVDSIAYNNYVEVSTHDAGDFFEMAKQKGNTFILRDRAATGVLYFCFADHGIIYRIKAHGLETLDELATALELKLLKKIEGKYEFVQQTMHFPGVTVEILLDPSNPESEVDSKIIAQKKYLSTPQKIIKAVTEGGFATYDQFVEAYKLGFWEHGDYETAMEKGFKNARDYFEAKEGYFSSAEEFYKAQERGFKSKILFDKGSEKGYTNFGDFRVGERGGFANADEFHKASSKGIFTKREFIEK